MSNSALGPVVQGDIVLSINAKYNTDMIFSGIFLYSIKRTSKRDAYVGEQQMCCCYNTSLNNSPPLPPCVMKIQRKFMVLVSRNQQGYSLVWHFKIC